MRAFTLALCLLLPQWVSGAQVRVRGKSSANPIRRVVTMLQAMQKKVEEEHKRDEELFDQFMCYCKSGGSSLQKSIAEAETKIPQLQSTIKELSAEKSQLEGDITQHKRDRDDAKSSIQQATSVREREAADYASEKTQGDTNVAAMTKAIEALEKGMGDAFIQTSEATMLRRVITTSDLADSDRDVVTAFLSGSQSDSEGYEPQSGEVVGILKQMKDTMIEELAEAEKTETDSIAEYNDLMAAKGKEVEALQKMVEDKTTRFGDASVELVSAQEDLEDTSTSLEEDRKFLADLDTTCKTKQAEWDERSKIRSEELVAIADTIKILNDDDALELFKKTLPSPSELQETDSSVSLLQVTMTNKQRRRKARAVLQAAARAGDRRLGFLAVSLQGRRESFDKVMQMVDNMIVVLGEEQGTDDKKKAYCVKEFDDSEDQKKALDLTISDLDKMIEDGKSAFATLGDEITALAAGIKELDGEVDKATAIRKEENAAFVQELASNHAAMGLLDIAKNRLNQFYNPKLATPEEETEEEPASLMQTASAISDSQGPGPAPETFGAYKKKSQESTGVLAMIDMLVADLTKDTQEMELEEKKGQADYEIYMKDSADKRAEDSKLIAEKEGQKAGVEETLNKHDEEKKDKVAEAAALAEYTANLHQECDWLMSNFDTRKDARASEVESLNKAKAILSGADYSFLQMNSKHVKTRRRFFF